MTVASSESQTYFGQFNFSRYSANSFALISPSTIRDLCSPIHRTVYKKRKIIEKLRGPCKCQNKMYYAFYLRMVAVDGIGKLNCK